LDRVIRGGGNGDRADQQDGPAARRGWHPGNCSGAGRTSRPGHRTITPGTDLTAGSRILCTLESNQGGLAIQRVTKDTATDTFKVFLSATLAAGKMAKVGWFVIG